MKRILNRLFFLVVFGAIIFLQANVKVRASGLRLYVSVNGNDLNPGSKKQPLASLNAAVEKLRDIKMTQQYKDPIEIIVGGGKYFMEEPVVLEQEDSGNEKSPVIIRAENGQCPYFTGSVTLKEWWLLEDESKLLLLDSSIAGKVYVTSLKELGIKNLGDPTDLGERPDLICNGNVQTLARWPDQGFTLAGQAIGRTELPLTYVRKHGTKEGDFEYIGKRQDRWANEPDARAGGYWYWDWSEEFHRIGRIDTVSRTLYIREPYHRYGYKDSLRYFGLNLFCEIDRPGEWYLDRNSGLLYWYPPEGIIPAGAEVTFTLFSAPYMVEMKKCSYLKLQGLRFIESRGSGILIREGGHCLIEDCRFDRFGRDGIHVEGGTHHGISGCMLATLGCSGIKMSGGDRKNLIPADHFIKNCIVKDFSLFKRTYEPAVHLSGCGIRISHNRFSNSSSSAMRLEGNDFLIEFNKVDHVVNESDDQGGIDIFYNPSYRGIVIRYNHWSDITGGTRHGAAGVRLDDMISGVLVYGNLFERCGARDFGAVQIHGGKDNTIGYNLFYECNAAVSFTPWNEERWLKELDSPQIRKKIYEDVDISTPVYLERYPELKDIRQNPNVNKIGKNLIVDCRNQFLRKNDKQVENNNIALPSGGKTVQSFYSGRLLKKYGLKPIPVHQMGPEGRKMKLFD